MIKPKLVEVTWHDAHTRDGWHQPAEVYDLIDTDHPYEVRTLGFLLNRNKARIIVAQSRNVGYDRFDGIHEIPMGMVKKVRVLK